MKAITDKATGLLCLNNKQEDIDMLNTIRSTLPAGTQTPHFALESAIEQLPGYSMRWLIASDRLAPMAQITSPDGERLGVIVYINDEWLCHRYAQEEVA